jgi:hypothetical protein
MVDIPVPIVAEDIPAAVDTLLRLAATLRLGVGLAVADTRLRVVEDIQLRVMAAVDTPLRAVEDIQLRVMAAVGTPLRAVVVDTRPPAAVAEVAVDSIRRAATMDPITDVTDDKF